MIFMELMMLEEYLENFEVIKYRFDSLILIFDREIQVFIF